MSIATIRCVGRIRAQRYKKSLVVLDVLSADAAVLAHAIARVRTRVVTDQSALFKLVPRTAKIKL